MHFTLSVVADLVSVEVSEDFGVVGLRFELVIMLEKRIYKKQILYIGLTWCCDDETGQRTKDTTVESQNSREQMLLSVANGTNHNFKYVHISIYVYISTRLVFGFILCSCDILQLITWPNELTELASGLKHRHYQIFALLSPAVDESWALDLLLITIYDICLGNCCLFVIVCHTHGE